ncbi:MAG: hypothetical protein MUF81_20495 [Verrucomicrobia bacterium]|jgi:hypothetical protein|nr:hypothetical protein [Verrucomicrobiota bacterium]
MKTTFISAMRYSYTIFERIAMWVFRCYGLKLSPVVLMVGVGLGLTDAKAVVIDDFGQGSALLEPTNYSPALITLQTGLNTNLTIGGTRLLTAQTQNRAILQVDAVAGQFSFEAVSDDGYFGVRYGSQANLGVDVRADGSEAFLLRFSEVHAPGLWRGRYYLHVNGVGCGFLEELAAINGAGTIRIPFSKFLSAPTFIVNTIELEASRVETGYRLVLDSIETVSADTPPSLAIATFGPNEIKLAWGTNATGFVVEKRLDLGAGSWEMLTNAVSVAAGQFSVTVDASETFGCFRLRRE